MRSVLDTLKIFTISMILLCSVFMENCSNGSFTGDGGSATNSRGGNPGGGNGSGQTPNPNAINDLGQGENASPTATPSISALPSVSPSPVSSPSPASSPSPTKSPLPTSSPAPTQTPVAKIATVKWNWTCPSLASGADVRTGSNQVINGANAFTFNSAQIDGAALTLAGTLCAPSNLQRQIIFIVDTSSSMGPPPAIYAQDPTVAPLYNHDPLVNGSCGRLSAIQSTISALSSEPGVSFGAITFATGVKTVSKSFDSSYAGLTSDLTTEYPGQSMAQIFCAADGDTNYGDPLTAAKALFDYYPTPAGVLHEIYFISDGEPNTNNGLSEAGLLKSQGVTIGTIMLIGQAGPLQALASVDAKGDPLSVQISNAGSLTSALSTLAAGSIVSGTISYRPVGASAWNTINVMPLLNGLGFSAPAFPINAASMPSGLQVEETYYDNHGHEFDYSGQLNW